MPKATERQVGAILPISGFIHLPGDQASQNAQPTLQDARGLLWSEDMG